MSIKITDSTGAYILVINTSSEVAVDNKLQRRLLEKITESLNEQNKVLEYLTNVLNNGITIK